MPIGGSQGRNGAIGWSVPKVSSGTKLTGALTPALKRSKAVSKKAASIKTETNRYVKEMAKRGHNVGGSGSVAARKPSAKVKPSSGRMSSRYNPRPRKGNQR